MTAAGTTTLDEDEYAVIARIRQEEQDRIDEALRNFKQLKLQKRQENGQAESNPLIEARMATKRAMEAKLLWEREEEAQKEAQRVKEEEAAERKRRNAEYVKNQLNVPANIDPGKLNVLNVTMPTMGPKAAAIPGPSAATSSSPLLFAPTLSSTLAIAKIPKIDGAPPTINLTRESIVQDPLKNSVFLTAGVILWINVTTEFQENMSGDVFSAFYKAFMDILKKHDKAAMLPRVPRASSASSTTPRAGVA